MTHAHPTRRGSDDAARWGAGAALLAGGLVVAVLGVMMLRSGSPDGPGPTILGWAGVVLGFAVGSSGVAVLANNGAVASLAFVLAVSACAVIAGLFLPATALGGLPLIDDMHPAWVAIGLVALTTVAAAVVAWRWKPGPALVGLVAVAVPVAVVGALMFGQAEFGVLVLAVGVYLGWRYRRAITRSADDDPGAGAGAGETS